jgi:general secretion pathway protein D
MRAHLSIALILALPLTAWAGEPKVDKGEAKRLLDSMTEKEKAGQVEVLKVTDRKIRAQRHYGTAKRLFEDRKYAEARKEADLAVQYDPTNANAKKLLRLVNSVLAVRRARIRTMTQHLERREQIKRQEQLMKLQNHVDRAKVLMARATAGKGLVSDVKQLAAEQQMLDQADRELVRAREIAKWMPAYVPVKQFEESIETMLDRVFKERKARQAKLKALGKERAAAEALKQRERDESFRRRRVRMLMDKAEMLFEREDYEEAGRLARRIMELDPTNAAAVELKTRCRVKSIDKRSARTVDLKTEAIKDWVELSKRATIPHSRVLVYPKNWDEISRRESLEEKRLQEPEWKRQLRAALEKEVNLEFTEMPLEECINYLRGLTKANIITDTKAFAAGGVDAKTPITLRLSKTRLGLALKWILRMAKLDYAMKNGAIFISTPANLQGELVQKIYDVRDLTFQIQNFPGPSLGLGGGGAAGGAVVAPPPPARIVEPNTLQEMIKKVIRSSSWGAGNTSITEQSGKLIVVHQPEVHAQISQLLEDFRKSQTLQVHVEARYLDVKQGFLEEIGVHWGGHPEIGWNAMNNTFDGSHPTLPDGTPGAWDGSYGRPDGKPGFIESMAASWGTHRGTGSTLSRSNIGFGGLHLGMVYLGNFQLQGVLDAVKSEERSTVLFAPRLTMFNNQRAHMFVGRQTSYISGWSSSGDVFTPDVSTAILDGVSLDVRPIVSHDRRYITMELRPTLVRPVDQRSFTRTQDDDDDDDDDDDNASRLNFSLPELEVRTIRTVVTVPDGGTVLLSGLMSERQSDQHQGIPFLMNLPVIGRLFGTNFKDVERRNLLILVTAKLILFSEEEQKL